jgi:glyoxylase-like metal-dependent hydrolase (beta-lactamase superfamily II)
LRTAGTNHDNVPGVRLVHAPGHTPGHRAVLLSDGDEGLMLTGDLLHQPVQIAEREWFSAHDEDPLLGVASRRLLLWRAESHGYRIGVSHFAEPFGSIERGHWVGDPG